MALAACMLHEPRLLLLDEPTAGVDPKARRDFWDELQGLAARGISVLVSTHYMDEASRCHKLGYIAYGRLLAQGTSAEVIASQQLSSWAIHGDRLIELQEKLRGQPGVDQTVIFGGDLHVSGRDAEALERSVRNTIAATAYRAEKIETGLEDVFIYMMSLAADNFGGES
jgi:ABC-2 type transport system ATP-binding protein